MDYFHFTVHCANNKFQVSKRIILSDTTSRLFDPLGLLGPIIVKAKAVMQLKLDWDESVPAKIHTEWIDFREQLLAIQWVHIPRNVTHGKETTDLQLHGFCDASEVAYGAFIYVRSVESEREVKLLCAESRIAPLKKLTIPRLELCSALILAQFIKIQISIYAINSLDWTNTYS
ncbi:hypothetical protein J437_LFUL018514 [Ladona fulva]|uniref:Uncharacterized protein n=1 Tax=Ladona fulva TaxID=123851 RepID=A0A8K0PDD7_LADFU|nr:hypothetical protein J437_LFUL018514 [Ladona fulva]